MKLAIMKFVFTIIMLVCWSVTALNNNIEFPILNSYMNESLRYLCENELISLNFSNAAITNIQQDFISSPLITCLNMNNNIEKIGRGAFNKLPNLTQLYLSNNRFYMSDLFNFGSHYKLQVLVVNNNAQRNYGSEVLIFDEYPNLEILSLRGNHITHLSFSPKKTTFDSSLIYTTSIITQKTPFPKLKSLDLSENNIRKTSFFELLPNNLYFLDLHDNLLESFNLTIGSQLFALNLDNNCFNNINNNKWQRWTLTLAGLKNLHYLSVFRNNINQIEPNAFQDNNKLIYLNLSRNDISYIYPETFANLQYLKTLDLSENKLKVFPQISNEIEINTLYINHNNITKLMSCIFMQMPKMMKLLLGENQINEIDVNAFASLSVLEELDLSKNMLNSLPEGWAESLISLKYLDLSDNQFTSLEFLSLPNTLSLTEIYLMLNPLEYLNVRYFTESLPQNLTINLTNKSNFTKWIIYGYERDNKHFNC